MIREWHKPLAPEQEVPAPASGVYLGRNKSGSLTLRIFRPEGTRIVVFSGPFAARLIALRAATTGASVRVVTDQPEPWGPVLQHGPGAQLLPATGSRPPAPPGPWLIVEEQPDRPRPLGEVSEWQCLLDIRNLQAGDDARSSAAELASFGHADVAFFGALSKEAAAAAGRVFDLGEGAAALTVVPPHAVAVVARGNVQLVRLEATPGEREVLRV